MKFKHSKIQIVLAFICVISGTVTGQIGIGVSGTVNSSAALEVNSNSKGFLPPRMTTSQRDAISSPADGLIIYNSTTGKLNIRENGDWSELSTTNRDQSISGNRNYSGNNAFGSNTILGGSTVISGTTTISGASTFNNSATFNNTTTLAGTNSISGQTTISGASTFTNTATFSSPAVFNSTLKLPTVTPGTTTSGMIYFNTSKNVLTVRNSANNGYIEFASLSGNNTFAGINTFSNSNSFSGANSFTGNNSFSGTNTFTGNVVIPSITTATRDALSSPTDGMIIYNTTTKKLNIRENGVWSEMTSNNRANTLSGTNTVNGMTTFNGMITMNAHMMVPMAELGFYSTSGITTNISSTAWAGNSNSSSGWSIVNWPALGSNIGTNTFVDSMSGLAGRINHSNSGSGAGVLAYKGSTTKHFHIALTFSFQGSGSNGNNHKNLIFGVFKNGVLLPESIVAVANVTSFASTAIHVMTDMDTGDYLDFRVIGIGGSNTATLTFISGNFFAMGI